MLSKTPPTQLKSWKRLKELSQSVLAALSKSPKEIRLGNPGWRIDLGNMVFDFSRNLLDKEVLIELERLADEANIREGYRQLISGDEINETENRSVLHPALRNPAAFDLELDGLNVREEVESSLKRIEKFSNEINSSKRTGFSGLPFTDIVNIGIGGSDLGPYMVTEALKEYWKPGIKPHFVSNVDPFHLDQTLKELNPQTTLFIISSKTFTTQETMANAEAAKSWFIGNGGNELQVQDHFIAVSTNIEAAQSFGVDKENVFGFWDWVGGRYSLWSAIGISIACTIGYHNFKKLLKGASKADKHFKDSEFKQNIPLLMALIGIWNTNFLGAESEAILPYSQGLHRFPAYLQQANMESNGKAIDRSGNPVDYSTGPIVWGEPGTNGQHAFFQLLHQGTHLIPCDLILFSKTNGEYQNQHDMLLANGLAQAKALWEGKSIETVKKQMGNEKSAQLTAPFRFFQGLNPSNILLFETLNPETMGFLIALYEHKIFAQGVIWNIFSYDQWGVELGKEMAGKLLPILNGKDSNDLDPTTSALIETIKKWG